MLNNANNTLVANRVRVYPHVGAAAWLLAPGVFVYLANSQTAHGPCSGPYAAMNCPKSVARSAAVASRYAHAQKGVGCGDAMRYTRERL